MILARDESQYIEFFGLGASGKSTLLASLKRSQKVTSRLKIISSESPGMVLHRLPRLGSAYNSSRSTWSLKAWSGMLLDSWARGTIDEYPELFSEVLMLCAAVPRENRKRAIVLNMWRSRLSVFFSTFSTDIPRVTIVDEGLGQSVLSLLWARASPGEWDTPGQIQMAKALLRALPRQRIMIFVDTPVDTLLKRRVRNQHLGREVLVTTREIAQAIVRETKAHGTSVIHLDGSKPPERICADLQTALGQLGHREIIFGG